MKTLQAFWHWFDNESPVTLEAYKKAAKVLSVDEHAALSEAATAIRMRGCSAGSVVPLTWCLDTHPEALRDLSLALCAALERMHEQVPEAPCDGCGQHPCDGTHMKCDVETYAAHRGKTVAEVCEDRARSEGPTLMQMAKKLREENQAYQREYLANRDTEFARAEVARLGRQAIKCLWSRDHSSATITVYLDNFETREQADQLRGMLAKRIVVVSKTATPNKLGCHIVNNILAPMAEHGASIEYVTP
jgi:hypothetical protein